MKTFFQFCEALVFLERFHSEHEPIIRDIASKARKNFYKNYEGTQARPFGSKFKGKYQTHRLSPYGHCEHVSNEVAASLKNKYPSAKVVDGHYLHPNGKLIPHAWVH